MKESESNIIRRVEDHRLITGTGSFVDDIKLREMLYAIFLRSPLGHARIKDVNTSRVESSTVILRGAEIDHVLPMISIWPGRPQPPFPLLAKDEVKYFGQPVLAVAAESRARAEDAVESIDVDFESLPVVVETEKALDSGAPPVHESLKTNLIGSWSHTSGDIESAATRADVVIEKRFEAQRVTGQAIEPRGALASYNRETGNLKVWLTSQCPHMDRTLLAECLNIPEEKIQVIAQDVGGGFGINSHLYPEQILTCLLSIRTGRPVKWVEDRREHVSGAIHSGDCIQYVTLYAKNDGTILGMQDRMIQNVGAYLQTRHIVSTFVTALLVPGPYRIPAYHAEISAVFSNKGPVGTYRAFGMTQATFARERMMDLLARRLGMDPLDVRMKNLIRSEEFPYANPAGLVYDSGNYEAAVARAIELSGYDRSHKRSPETNRGIGLGFFLEIGGVGNLDTLPTKGRKYVPKESARIVLHSDGRFVVYSGVAPTGQGLETTLAKIVADEFDIDPGRVSVVHGDTNSCPYSADGTIASRSANLAGNAVLMAARELKERLLEMAISLLNGGGVGKKSSYSDGNFVVDRASISLEQLARDFYSKNASSTLEQVSSYEPVIKSGTAAFGVHVADVRVDRETGFVSLERMVMVHDCGTILNPTVVEGMAHGGIAQGISASLLEQVAYSDEGQILTSTLGDYLIPTSLDMPPVITDHTVTPSPTNPLGVKGGGEGGIVGVPAAIANAVEDALGLGQESATSSKMLFAPEYLIVV